MTPRSAQQDRLYSTATLFRLLADPASFHTPRERVAVSRGKPGPAVPVNITVMDEVARITAEAAEVLDEVLEALMPLDDVEQYEENRPRDLPGTYTWLAERWPQIPAGLASHVDDVVRGHAARAVRILRGHPQVTRMLRCPHCGCVSLLPDPAAADVLLCTNRACSPGPGPRRFALADGGWDGLVFGAAC